MANIKGSPKTGGRLKGSPNKHTTDMRAAMVEAFDRAGGVEYLVKLAATDPKTFCSLVSKIIPTEIKAQIDGDLSFTVVTGVPRASD